MGRPIEEFKRRLDQATASSGPDNLAGTVVIAATASGEILQKVESGTFLPHLKNPKRTIDKSRQNFSADTVCWIASCTKLMTTIAVMQQVDRGVLKLDDDVTQTWLPEFKDYDVLVRGQNDGGENPKPTTKKMKNRMTLRNLLSHTSGIAYEFTQMAIQNWRQWSVSTPEGKANARSPDIARAMKVPLYFEPSEGWVYGYGIDWAGLALMRATGKNLEELFSENIWKPLGMTSTTFSVKDHRPDLLDRLTAMNIRNGEGGLDNADNDPVSRSIERVKYGGGGGCYSTANDYIKLVVSLLNTATGHSSDVPQLLKTATVNEMLTGQLSEKGLVNIHRITANPIAYGLAGNLPPSVKKDYGLGGILNLTEVPATGRKAGAIQWSGLPNLFWWVSPADGVAGCYFTQVLPPGDKPNVKMYEEFEKAVLEEQKLSRKGKL
ncbi:beta-lactamase/transpeptidase-like protein [Microthyrium microscopicum]|uniref:Beta-lactamase/transpeptidase-like protein n=1 Tax=Microthyrium microscopicum TaxID=703497 RepID=A0A6A6UQT9_9PEZI|nr:beta-lactamase/transpeptidase-like protein [Microthyrium microscopicum]